MFKKLKSNYLAFQTGKDLIGTNNRHQKKIGTSMQQKRELKDTRKI